ncbi:MAG: PorV/PorQ family protein [Bacteroidota bacterium]|nr:PorV/PorQ family protein [Bacteroidota bacterium]MDE2833435.1 PorV/PorQ family protein [Bacteroidota bacterium]
MSATLCRKAVSLTAISAVLTLSAFGQKVGTSSMQFLSVAPDARAMGVGTAYSALAAGAHALYWNPAGLTRASGHDLALDRVDYFLDAAHYGVAYGAALGSFGHLGVQFYLADMGSFQETRVDHLGFIDQGGGQVYNPGLTGATFTLRSWVAGLSYARAFTDRFSAGLTAKLAREDLWLADAQALLFDFGMTYATGFRTLRLGASVMNFGAPVTYGEDAFPVPLLFRLGGAMDLVGTEAPIAIGAGSRLTASFDVIQPNDYDQQWAAGMEYAFFERFIARAGYQHNHDIASYSFGIGLRQPLAIVRLGLDYSYSDMNEAFGAVHRIGISLSTD